MKKRPISVTVIAWLLIVLAGISLITTTSMLDNPEARELMSKSPVPLNLQYAMAYVGLVIMILSGIAMLKGLNLGRLLYVSWSAFALIVGFATSPMKAALVPSVFVFVVISVYLFRPRASEYFAPAEGETPDHA